MDRAAREALAAKNEAENAVMREDIARRREWRALNEVPDAVVDLDYGERPSPEMLRASREAYARRMQATATAAVSTMPAESSAAWNKWLGDYVEARLDQVVDMVAGEVGEADGALAKRIAKLEETAQTSAGFLQRIDDLEREIVLLRQLISGDIRTIHGNRGKSNAA
jgi:hypothetical protein